MVRLARSAWGSRAERNSRMPATRFIPVFSLIFLAFSPLKAGPTGGTLVGMISYKGTLPKGKPLDLSKEPACVKMHASDPLLNESIVVGPGNGLANVVVYISAGETDSDATPTSTASFDQKGCRYKTHVLPVQVGQEIRIGNSDPIVHNIHAMAKVNREWNRMEPPGTPPFSYSYEKEEFIPVKCNVHPWMQGYIVVLKTSHFAVTGESGVFRLPNLPQGKYTVTAWHESLGTQTREFTVTSGETTTVYIAFSDKP
jgi:plastocyanin